jgi:hypothetical protein
METPKPQKRKPSEGKEDSERATPSSLDMSRYPLFDLVPPQGGAIIIGGGPPISNVKPRRESAEEDESEKEREHPTTLTGPMTEETDRREARVSE